MSAFRLPDETYASGVHLRVRDLGEVANFYEAALGLNPSRQSDTGVSFGAPGEASEPFVTLTADATAVHRPRRATGLFHLAIRFPSRRDLAHALQRLVEHDYPLEGAAHHIVSEALYLSDPAGNGVELYADLPRAQWKWREGQIAMATEPLDLGRLLATSGAGRAPVQVPGGTDLGHIHLHVTDLTNAERFLHEFLGLDITQRSYPGALFFSAGGYHHHIAANTWGGASTPPPGSDGLISYRLSVPVHELLFTLKERARIFGYGTSTAETETGEVLQIRDPDGFALEIASAR